jgi:peptidyl-prolyl cis-trans isomerase C
MRLLPAVSLAILLTLSAPAHAAEYVVMKVNGQDVSSAEVLKLWNGLFPEGAAPKFDTAQPDMRDRILRAVIAEKLLYGEAMKQGVDKSAKFQAELEDIKKKLMVRSFLDAKTGDLITDADLKREYDTMTAGKKDEKQVRARHILLANEEDAKAAKKKLDEGKKFEDVAKDFSKDPGSAKQGGDLGFFTRDKMVKEFSDAAFAMKKGEVSAPVKSAFGWHIIKVEEITTVPLPKFSEVKEQMKAKLQEKKLNDYIGGLVKSAEVKVFDAQGKEIAFDRNLPTPPADASATVPVKAN